MTQIRYNLEKLTTPHNVVRRHLAEICNELSQRFNLSGEALDYTLRDVVRDALPGLTEGSGPPLDNPGESARGAGVRALP